MAATRERPVISAESAAPVRARPAFYALGGGRLGDALTLLHPPYTAWHLSYFALGAAVAPTLHVNRLLWGLAAFALAVGVSAHAFDELHSRPLGTSFSARTLVALGVIGLVGAVAIGVAGVLTVSVWLVALVAAGRCSCRLTTWSWRAGVSTPTCGSQSAGAAFLLSRAIREC